MTQNISTFHWLENLLNQIGEPISWCCHFISESQVFNQRSPYLVWTTILDIEFAKHKPNQYQFYNIHKKFKITYFLDFNFNHIESSLHYWKQNNYFGKICIFQNATFETSKTLITKNDQIHFITFDKSWRERKNFWNNYILL